MERLTNTINLAYVEDLYLEYLKDPSSVPPDWQSYFAKLKEDNGVHTDLRSGWSPQSPRLPSDSVEGNGREQLSAPVGTLQDQLNAMIHAYRTLGHRIARIDPLNVRSEREAELSPEIFGFNSAHLDLLFPGQIVHFNQPVTLRDIVQRLQNTYCGSIGVEFMDIDDRSAAKR